MPYPDSNNYKEKKKDNSKVYFGAVIIGVLMFVALLLFSKLLQAIFFVIQGYWKYLIGLVLVFMLLKKLFSKKTLVVKNENPYR